MRSTRWANRWAENWLRTLCGPPLQRFVGLRAGQELLQPLPELRSAVVLPAVLSLQDDALQAEIRPAPGRARRRPVPRYRSGPGSRWEEALTNRSPSRYHSAPPPGAPCRQRSLPGPPAADRGPPAPAGPVRTIPHQQQRHRAAAQGGPELQQLLDVLLLRKAPHAHQHSVFRRDAQAGPQNRPAHGIALLLEAPQVDARRHHEDRQRTP